MKAAAACLSRLHLPLHSAGHRSATGNDQFLVIGQLQTIIDNDDIVISK